MVRLKQGWRDIRAMPEDVFWAYAGMADEMAKEESKAAKRAKNKSKRRRKW